MNPQGDKRQEHKSKGNANHSSRDASQSEIIGRGRRLFFIFFFFWDRAAPPRHVGQAIARAEGIDPGNIVKHTEQLEIPASHDTLSLDMKHAARARNGK